MFSSNRIVCLTKPPCFLDDLVEANELSVSSDLKGAQALHGDIAQTQRETSM